VIGVVGGAVKFNAVYNSIETFGGGADIWAQKWQYVTVFQSVEVCIEGWV
jgi:hypothetical protein